MATEVAARIREARDDLTGRWLERISARVDMDPGRIFPSEELLDHIPVLMVGIADYVESPFDEITADVPVIAKAMELGTLRFSQGFDASEILKEYEILGGVLFSFAAMVVAGSNQSCPPENLLVCAHRLFRAIAVVEQVTTAHYLRVLGERVGEREERLRRFNRMITHELKNRVGATLGAGQLLQEDWLGDAERRRFAAMVTENAEEIQKVMENLTALSQLEEERRRHRHILLGQVVEEVFRQLRHLARARRVELRVAGELPEIEVSAATVELSLSNYLSNAIKYSDANAAERWAEVQAELEPAAEGSDHGRLIVRVHDNGPGVPQEHRDRLFERFFRSPEHEDGVEGTGLGLNLVRETLESLGGSAWAEFERPVGATFAFSLPCRRVGEQRFSALEGAPAGGEDLYPPAAEPAKASD